MEFMQQARFRLMGLTMANYPLACKGDIYEQLGENKTALSFAGTKRA
ncbi:putative membrane protein [Edwardsiella piscicida]|nr:putative membrane protein [Edwardsiella piscicida]